MRRLIDLVEAAEITAYHGTGSRFSGFYDSSVSGNFFTTDREYATAYAGKTTPTHSGKAKSYLITAKLRIENPLDTKHDPDSVDFYNGNFVPTINRIRSKYGQQLLPETEIGTYVSFIYADDLYRYMKRYGSPYDAILVDEGGISPEPAIVPMSASQIKIVRREVLK